MIIYIYLCTQNYGFYREVVLLKEWYPVYSIFEKQELFPRISQKMVSSPQNVMNSACLQNKSLLPGYNSPPKITFSIYRVACFETTGEVFFSNHNLRYRLWLNQFLGSCLELVSTG